jgi:hypothetical protein
MHGVKVGEIHRNQFDQRVRELLNEMQTLSIAIETIAARAGTACR